MTPRRLLFLFLSVVPCWESSSAVGPSWPEKSVPSKPSPKDADATIHSILERVSQVQEHRQQHAQRAVLNEATDDIILPFVTLSYAQSLDGRIALRRTSSNFAISGPYSLRMTHALRSHHDVILVGGATLSVDNPRLSNRLWTDVNAQQPRPVVLDAQLRHAGKLGASCKARRLIICCDARVIDSIQQGEIDISLPEGAELLPCEVLRNESGERTSKLDVNSVLQELSRVYGIRTIMVEGGAGVLSSFLQSGYVDCLCVTLSPSLILGEAEGLPAFADTTASCFGNLKLCDDGVFQLGGDCVIIGEKREN